MRIHKAATQHSLNYLRQGISVSLVGPPQVGKSRLARGVADTLESEGWAVFRVRGVRHFRESRFSGLRDTFDLPRGPFDVADATDALSERMVSSGTALLLIDDPDDLDPHSLDVVQTIIGRRLARTLLTRSTLGLGPFGTAAGNLIAPTGVRIDVGALGWGDMGVLLSDELGGEVHPDVVSAVLAPSGGIAGFATEIVRAARAEGSLRQADGQWRLDGSELWSPAIDGWTEGILARLQPQERELLTFLALQGPTPLTQLDETRLRLVEGLEGSRLVTIVESDTPFLLPFPPAIVEYLRQRAPASMIHRMRRDATHDERGTFLHDLPPGRSTADDDPVLSLRYFRDHAGFSLRAARDRWRTSPSLANATRYLGALLDHEGSEREIEELVAQVPLSDSDDSRAAFEFAFVRELWERDQRDRTTQPFEDFAHAFPEWTDQVDILTRALDIDAGASHIADQPFDRHPETGVSGVADAYIHLIEGDSEGALDILATTAEKPLESLQRFAGFIESIARSSIGHHQQALESSQASLRQSRQDLDRFGVFLHSYAATLSLIALGRWEEAERQVGHALALGRGGPGSTAFYVALLRLGAVLNICLGRTRLALPLIEEASNIPVADTGLPAAQRAVGDVLRELATGDRQKANDMVAQHIQGLLSRDHRLAAVATALLALGIYPSESTLDLLEAADTHPGLVELLRSVRANPNAAHTYVDRFTETVNIGLAVVALRSLSTEYGGAGSLDASTIAGAADRLEERAGWVTTSQRTGGEGTRAMLTSREREIGLLAGQLSNAEIASRLHLSRRTVENHLHRAMRKTNTHGRSELVAYLATS